MSLGTPHAYLGLIIVSSWAIVAGWSLALRFLRYEHTPTFWKAVSVAQVLLGVQLLVGLILLVTGHLPGENTGAVSLFNTVFHTLYGFVFPFVVLFVAHKWAREQRYDTYSTFALAAFIIFGLTARGWMVGAGIG